MNEERELKCVFAELLAEKVKHFQGKDFEEWHRWKKLLEKVDPDNPLLNKGFRGLPYGWR